MLNGSAECLNRSLMEKTKPLLYYCATYRLNRGSTSLKCTPAEEWFNKIPGFPNLIIFVSIVYAKKLGYIKKLEKRFQKCIFLGYAPNGYGPWNESKCKMIIARDVAFSDEMHQNDRSSHILSFGRWMPKYENDESTSDRTANLNTTLTTQTVLEVLIQRVAISTLEVNDELSHRSFLKLFPQNPSELLNQSMSRITSISEVTMIIPKLNLRSNWGVATVIDDNILSNDSEDYGVFSYQEAIREK
ncbi:hypothetical protein JTB14_027906 [Gonioctena quinquepunctata]|nr:hypothetical protein JTB14_027906 [Gonioctena quinquepunctata]